MRPGRTVCTIFIFGLLVSALMVARSQVTEDQLNLLARGWRFAVEGDWVWHAVPASLGGKHPGGLMSLFVGAPLLLWADHRAATVLVLASQALGFLALNHTLKGILGSEERVLFAALYWLNPWRLFYSGFLWNPNFLFICGALHLSTAYRLRRRSSFAWTFAHVLVLGMAIQFHLSALLLVASTLVLWWRRYLRLDLIAAVAAGAVVALTLVPWFLVVLENPSLRPVSEGSSVHGFERLGSMLRGLMQWLRFPGLSLSFSMACLDLTSLGGPGNPALAGWAKGVRAGLALPTFALSLWANWRLWREPGEGSSTPDGARSDRAWLAGLVRWSFVTAILVFAASPMALSSHNVLVVFHLALLPVVFAVGAQVERWSAASRAWVVTGYATLSISLALVMALGSPPYRCGGPICEADHFRVSPLQADHPMLDDLAINNTCEAIVGDPVGFWPDALPAPGTQ